MNISDARLDADDVAVSGAFRRIDVLEFTTIVRRSIRAAQAVRTQLAIVLTDSGYNVARPRARFFDEDIQTISRALPVGFLLCFAIASVRDADDEEEPCCLGRLLHASTGDWLSPSPPNRLL